MHNRAWTPLLIALLIYTPWSYINMMRYNPRKLARLKVEDSQMNEDHPFVFISPPRERANANIILPRQGNFSQIMIENGIDAILYQKTKMKAIPWIENTIHRWEHENDALTQQTIKNLLTHHIQYYTALGDLYSKKNYKDAVRLLSAYPNGEEPHPGMGVFYNATVRPDGFVQERNRLIVIKGCTEKGFSTNKIPAQYFDDVVTISQYWGESYFHFIGEDIVRLPIAMEYLSFQPKKNNNYKIHVRSINHFVADVMNLFGIQKHRLVEGWIGAGTLYLPEPTPCGTPPAYGLNQVRRMIWNRLEHEIVSPPRHSMVLIQRKKNARSITNLNELKTSIHQHFPNYHIEVHDGEMPFRDQMTQFMQTQVVIGAHGAGLVNMVSCAIGTIIIEFLTSEINICYTVMASKLMLRYYGITIQESNHYSPMKVNVEATIQRLTRGIKDQNKTRAYLK